MSQRHKERQHKFHKCLFLQGLNVIIQKLYDYTKSSKKHFVYVFRD